MSWSAQIDSLSLVESMSKSCGLVGMSMVRLPPCTGAPPAPVDPASAPPEPASAPPELVVEVCSEASVVVADPPPHALSATHAQSAARQAPTMRLTRGRDEKMWTITIALQWSLTARLSA